jgi:hypothetical protein
MRLELTPASRDYRRINMKPLHIFLIVFLLCLTALAIALIHEHREDARARMLAPPTMRINSR